MSIRDPQKKKENDRRYYIKHRESISAKAKIYWAKNSDKKKKYAKEWWARNKDKWLERNRERVLRYKQEFVAAYGGCCSCCGEDEIRFLTVEHINRDGKKHREQVGAGTGTYLDLRRRGYPKDAYTVLCCNCNFSQRKGDPCPHKLKISKVLFGVAA